MSQNMTPNENIKTFEDVVHHLKLEAATLEAFVNMAEEGHIGLLAKTSLPTCEHCLMGKVKRKPLRKVTRASFPLQLIHSHICGPMNVRARHGGSYFITFFDDYTRYGHVYLISHMFESLDCIRRYMILIDKQLDKSMKALTTDSGCEYPFEKIKVFYEEKRN
jgi:hypothetical protein